MPPVGRCTAWKHTGNLILPDIFRQALRGKMFINMLRLVLNLTFLSKYCLKQSQRKFDSMLWREKLSFQNRAWNKQTPVHDTKCEPVLQTKTLICFSNKQRPSPQHEKREFCCLCVLNAVEKQERCVTWSSDLPTPSPPLDRASPRSYYSLTYSGWGEGRSDLWPAHQLQPSTPAWKRKRPTTERRRPRSISIASH